MADDQGQGRDDQSTWKVHNPELSTFPLLNDAEPSTKEDADPGTFKEPEPEPEPQPEPVEEEAQEAEGTTRRGFLGIVGPLVVGGVWLAASSTGLVPERTRRLTTPAEKPRASPRSTPAGC